MPPTRLEHGELRARVLTRADLAEDVRGINASLELIPRTRGGDWPTEAVTEEFDFADLVWHEVEFRDGYSYSYAVYDAAGGYVGCAYLYPMGRRTPLTAELIHHDVDVSWWVTPEAYDRRPLRRALPRVAGVGHDGLPLHHALLLEPGDPSMSTLVVGVPREIKDNEKRVALTPDGVVELAHGGHEVRRAGGRGRRAPGSPTTSTPRRARRSCRAPTTCSRPPT